MHTVPSPEGRCAMNSEQFKNALRVLVIIALGVLLVGLAIGVAVGVAR